MALRAVTCGLLLAHSLHLLFWSGWPLHLIWAPAFLSGMTGYIYASEYLVTAIINPTNLSHRSFLMDISPIVNIMSFWAVCEHFILLRFWPQFLFSPVAQTIAIYGFVQCLVADVLRKWSVIQLGDQFNVEIEGKTEHHDESAPKRLVTHGIYSAARHPSYVATFSHLSGSVLVLRAPICFLLFVPLFWLLFTRRIAKEERLLVDRFQDEYESYRARVPAVFVPRTSHKLSFLAFRLAHSLESLGLFIERDVFMNRIPADTEH